MIVKFMYKDKYSNGEWLEQECSVRSVKECKELYGLGIDCDYRILDVKENKTDNYINSKAILKEDILDLEEENILIPKGTEVTILSTECEVDGFGTDYVNVKDNMTGEVLKGISSSCLRLI